MKKVIKNINMILIGFLLIFYFPLQIHATSASKSSDTSSLAEAQKQKDDLESSLKEAQDLISNLKNSKEDIETKIKDLDTKLTNISDKMDTLETNLNKKNEEITTAQSQLEQANEKSAQQYEDMKKRIRFMYENAQNLSYVELLISSKDMSDLISSADYIHELSEYDRSMLKEYQTTQTTIATKKEQLTKDYSDLKTMQSQLSNQQQAVEALKTEKNNQLSAVGDQINSATSDAQAYVDELQAQNEVIEEIKAQQAALAAKKKAEEEAKKAAEAEQAKANAQSGTQTANNSASTQTESDSSDSYTGGAFVWPSKASKTVTSDYGKRVSPTTGASTNHQGIDIGAPYGSDILAAASGTVIYSGYSAASGNHVIIDHGGEICTVYMHASALNVSVGDTVSAGQVIAKVGSTGISTGNHLHFGVTVNGSYVSPWNYLSK